VDGEAGSGRARLVRLSPLPFPVAHGAEEGSRARASNRMATSPPPEPVRSAARREGFPAVPSAPRPGLLRRYANRLPLTPATPLLTLGEGDTPLVPAPRLSSALGVDLHLKLEGQNPTGSFKDRGMVVAVAKAVEAGARVVVCASTGNTAASAAAYAARAGLRAAVLVPRGRVAAGKLAQAVMHGARILAVDGNFDEALALVRRLADGDGVALVNSVNPHRLEGQKTAAFEIVEALGGEPDLLALPVGNAGNITAYHKGFAELAAPGRPRLRFLGVQAAGANPLVRGEPVARPETVASAIRIGRPASWEGAVAAVAATGGAFVDVTDAEIVAAQRRLAREEGVFVEPASAAPIAGLFRWQAEGRLPAGLRVVAVLTGHGLKDPDAADRYVSEALVEVAPELDAVREAILAW
jgi:threonine synthase